MSEDGCPLCGKPVMGDTALLGHLEFGHDIDDPAAFLAELREPAGTRRARRLGARVLVRRALPVLAVVVLGAAGLVGYQQLVVGGDADTAAATTAGPEEAGAAPGEDGGEPTPSTAPEPADEPIAEPTTTVAPTTAPPTTAPTTTAAAATTTAAPLTTAPSADATPEFRKPFLLEPRHEGCAVRDGRAVHSFSFRFSGSRNITFDGRFHPDRSGDGPHTSTHAVPAGTTGYLDQVVVTDPGGTGHEVAVSPPIYLGSC